MIFNPKLSIKKYNDRHVADDHARSSSVKTHSLIRSQQVIHILKCDIQGTK